MKITSIEYHPKVVSQDIPGLDKTSRIRIQAAIENKLISDPLLYGSPLRSSLVPYWKLRVGDYRIVYRLYKTKIQIIVIAHRREVYDLASKRK